MTINNDIQLDFDDVLIEPQKTGAKHRGDIVIDRQFNGLNLSGCPIMTANMTQTGNFDMATVLLQENCFATLHKFYKSDEIINWLNLSFSGKYPKNLFVTLGLRNKDQEIKKIDDLCKLYSAEVNILIDVPNAYIETVVDYVKEIRAKFSKNNIAVGNVSSGDMVENLIKAGANIVKIGIGPSQVCDTRIKTGCGRSQLSAIIECARVAHNLGGYVIADGGFKTPADVCKAFVAGADFVMSGSFFAGTDESAGKIVTKYKMTDEYKRLNFCFFKIYIPIIKKQEYKEYYGMSSFRAQMENYGTVTKSGTSEGAELKLIPYVGNTKSVIDDIKGGLRSCGSYIGALNICDFTKYGKFYMVNRIK